jgi:hypothetical protein
MTIKDISPDNRQLVDEIERGIDAELERVLEVKTPEPSRSSSL